MRSSIILALAWGILGTAVPTAEGPVRVTGGKLSGSDSSVTDFSIDLSGDTLSGFVLHELEDVPHGVCDPCAPGFELSLSSRFTAFEAVSLNDVPYEVEGHFFFKSGTITVPDLPPGSRTTLVLPFRFNGHLRGLADEGPVNLRGSGLATVFLTNTGEGVNATRIDYDFTSP